MRYFLWLLFTYGIFSSTAFAQTIILEQEVEETLDDAESGPNKKNYAHFYLGYAWAMGKPESSGSDIVYGLSYNFNWGIRYKRKLTDFYAVGYDLNFHNSFFRIKQDSIKTLPNAILNKKEEFRMYQLGLLLYNRLNIGLRGNKIGNFFDFGASADFPYYIAHFTKNELPNGNMVKMITTKLDYIKRFQYYFYGRIGFNRYAITASYRLSDFFTEDVTYSELPRIVVGVQVGIHR